MHLSERSDGRTTDEARRAGPIDWRGWVVLAWVVWFGLLYGKMVVEQRAQKVRDLFPSVFPSRTGGSL